MYTCERVLGEMVLEFVQLSQWFDKISPLAQLNPLQCKKNIENFYPVNY